MSQFGSFNSLFGYYGRFQRARNDFRGLPAWARFVLLLTALPAIVLAALSILLIVVSIVALLLLTVPAYGLLRRLTGGSVAATSEEMHDSGIVVTEPNGFGESGRKRVDATVIDPPPDRPPEQ